MSIALSSKRLLAEKSGYFTNIGFGIFECLDLAESRWRDGLDVIKEESGVVEEPTKHI